jgi:hypothetical protein
MSSRNFREKDYDLSEILSARNFSITTGRPNKGSISVVMMQQPPAHALTSILYPSFIALGSRGGEYLCLRGRG